MRACFAVGLLLAFSNLVLLRCAPGAEAGQPAELPNYRTPPSDTELRFWLENMLWFHRFSDAEIADATGLTQAEIAADVRRFDIAPARKPHRRADDPLRVLPYPGGRHPRIGFLDGAVRPQRDTKISVFLPWDESSYVVADLPEAVWSDLGLTYLAHTHVPTIWSKQNIELEPLEWNRRPDGTFDFERKLPNGIRFGTKVMPAADAVRMEMWLSNGTSQMLSDLRVQNCLMLKGAEGFNDQIVENKVLSAPYAACRSKDGRHWIITAWEPCHRAWSNTPCPCLHSDPQFANCAPGETKRLKGWLSFFEGTDIEVEMKRIDETNWRKSP